MATIYEKDEESLGIIEYVHKWIETILESRQIFRENIRTESVLKDDINEKYLMNWNPHQSSLTFCIDISFESNESDSKELIEQWRITFCNHGTIDEESRGTQEKEQLQLKIEMRLQLRSLLSYVALLPLHNVLPPLNVVDTMDLFNINLGIDSSHHDIMDIPYTLSHDLHSAYTDYTQKTPRKQKTSNHDSTCAFRDYDDVDYYLFPLLQFGGTGSLQLSVFYLNDDRFNATFIQNNHAFSNYISVIHKRKRLNNKYLEMKVKQYMHEKQQQAIVLNALEANKNVDIDDEEEALYVDEHGNDTNTDTTFIDKWLKKIKIHIPRPCNLCVHILTQTMVKIGWKSDKSLNDYDVDTNKESKKFKFEIRSKQMRRNTDDIDVDIDIDIRETCGESMTYRDLEIGQIYKFQVRIMDSMNHTFVSKWSSTLSVVIPNTMNGNALSIEALQKTIRECKEEQRLLIMRLNKAERSLKIRQHLFIETVPSLSTLVKHWNELKSDAHLELRKALCDCGLMPSDRDAFQVLFDITIHCYNEMKLRSYDHNIMVNMDLYLHNNDDSCKAIVHHIVHNILRDAVALCGMEKDTEFAVHSFICECCRIIWCLLSSSKDGYQYILYPTQFEQNKHHDLDDEKRVEMIAMNVYDERIHKKETKSINNKKQIEYCSWPSIVKLNTVNHHESPQILTPAFVFCL